MPTNRLLAILFLTLTGTISCRPRNSSAPQLKNMTEESEPIQAERLGRETSILFASSLGRELSCLEQCWEVFDKDGAVKCQFIQSITKIHWQQAQEKLIDKNMMTFSSIIAQHGFLGRERAQNGAVEMPLLPKGVSLLKASKSLDRFITEIAQLTHDEEEKKPSELCGFAVNKVEDMLPVRLTNATGASRKVYLRLTGKNAAGEVVLTQPVLYFRISDRAENVPLSLNGQPVTAATVQVWYQDLRGKLVQRSFEKMDDGASFLDVRLD